MVRLPVCLGKQSSVHNREAHAHSEPLERASDYIGLGQKDESVEIAQQHTAQKHVAQLSACEKFEIPFIEGSLTMNTRPPPPGTVCSQMNAVFLALKNYLYFHMLDRIFLCNMCVPSFSIPEALTRGVSLYFMRMMIVKTVRMIPTEETHTGTMAKREPHTMYSTWLCNTCINLFCQTAGVATMNFRNSY